MAETSSSVHDADGAAWAADYNPMLRPWQRPEPGSAAGKGAIERPERVVNLVWQTRPAPPSEYENALADHLIACFDAGAEELPDLVAALNARGSRGPDGAPWTEQSFTAEMARLGW
ncbi:MAG: recombinase-like helix-turn-helix domain-containing protein [Acetobacteraceae bacterium]